MALIPCLIRTLALEAHHCSTCHPECSLSYAWSTSSSVIADGPVALLFQIVLIVPLLSQIIQNGLDIIYSLRKLRSMFLKRKTPCVVLLEHVTLSKDAEWLNLIILECPYLSQPVHAGCEYDRYVCLRNEPDSLDDVLVRLPLCNLIELEFLKERLYFSVSIMA